jgi:DNA-binding response OmpR family regulator
MPQSWDVLVVDDEPVVRDGITRVLSAEGLHVATAPDGRSALLHPAAATCRLVLCDVMLPDLSGLEVLRELRARRPDLPVLLMTGYALSDLAGRAADAGAADVLAKPFDASELLAATRRFLGGPGSAVEEKHP